MSGIQSAVDALCADIGRSVAIDSPDFELIVASAQVGEIDEVRASQVMNRKLDPSVKERLRALRLELERDPVDVAGDDDIGTLPRVCFPLRHLGRPIGFLIVIDSPPLTPDLRDVVASRCASVTEALADSLGLSNQFDAALVDLAEHYLIDDSERAADRARAKGYLRDGDPEVIVLDIVDQAAGEAPPERLTTNILRDVLTTHSKSRLSSVGLHHRPGELVLVTSERPGEEIATSLVMAVERSARHLGLGLGAVGRAAKTPSIRPSLALGRARFAQAIARQEGAPRRWEDLGSWILLFERPRNLDSVREISPGAAAVIETENEVLWRSWLAYLDCGRNVKAACEVLHVHRATLYYRLGRIRELAGPDAVEDGWTATSAHVALRFWQFAQGGASSLPPLPPEA